MPLHLLSKKSWNVYNPAAVARVRADEAAETAREEAEDQRQQAHDAERRLAILRGLPPPELPLATPIVSLKRPRSSDDAQDPARGDRDNKRKQRRLRGEDDTDRDIRLAQRERDRNDDDKSGPRTRKPGNDAPLTDHAGHIQLFAPPSTKDIRVSKDAVVEHKQRERESAEMNALRFSDAAGIKKDIKQLPWYAGSRLYSGTEEMDPKCADWDNFGPGKDAFGNGDAGRGKRDAARLSSADPMAIMRQAQTRLKEVESERDRWRRERDRELKELEASQEKEERRKRRRRRASTCEKGYDELDGFSLDAPHTPKAAGVEIRPKHHRRRDSVHHQGEQFSEDHASPPGRHRHKGSRDRNSAWVETSYDTSRRSERR